MGHLLFQSAFFLTTHSTFCKTINFTHARQLKILSNQQKRVDRKGVALQLAKKNLSLSQLQKLSFLSYQSKPLIHFNHLFLFRALSHKRYVTKLQIFSSCRQYTYSLILVLRNLRKFSVEMVSSNRSTGKKCCPQIFNQCPLAVFQYFKKHLWHAFLQQQYCKSSFKKMQNCKAG